MQTADRLKKIPPYLFMTLRNKINEAKAKGIDVISLAIGDPVEATPQPIIDALCKAAQDPANHPYPTDEEWGMRALRDAIARWYKRRYDVDLDAAKEIVALIGSKEGCHHFGMAVINPGDTVLVTDPGYPGYKPAIWFAGGEPYAVPMKSEENFLPNFANIPTDVAKKASAFFLNYPNNPTGAVATPQFLNELVEFAKSNDIVVCYDNPYSEVVFGVPRLSFLSAPGAKEVGIEFNSLSKPYNMTGWRIGMASGNPDIVKAIATSKANTDSGIFNAIQYAGIAALDECDSHIDVMLEIYGRRRNKIIETLRALGWTYDPPKGAFYLWVPVPQGFTSASFCDHLLETCAVVVAPGAGYGVNGEGFVRFSLTVTDARLDEALARMRERLPVFTF
ncbi:MAG: LL-diaminopimelate aminotransferase [Candidatus Hydrogenedentes bacterium]|nr:LL-diaminopimelate aminotransferase [Candidatus Hydrogenedentota bacterium]